MIIKKNINENKKDIVIIGGGLSGLYTGIKLLLKGYNVTIIEKNNNLGGKLVYYNQYYPYIINNEKLFLKLLNDIDIVIFEDLFININNIVVIYNNEKIVIPSKLEPFHILLNSYCNDESSNIKEYKKISNFIMLIKQIKKGNVNKKYQAISIEDYVLTFDNINIRNILNNILPSNYSLISLLNYLNDYFNNELKVLNFNLIKQLEEKYRILNGKILLGKNVSNISFKNNNNIEHLILDDLTVVKGDYFISTIDPYYLFKHILNNRYQERKFNLRYENGNMYKTDNKIIISFNIDKPFIDDMISVNFNQLTINTTSVSTIYFYKSINKNMIYCEIIQNKNDYEMYKIIYNNKKMMLEINKKIIYIVINEFQKHYPEYALTINNILTPIDINLQFNSFNGAIKGFIPSLTNIIVDEEIKGLKNIFNYSSWLSSTGGIINAMLVSKECVNRLEKRIKNEKK